MSAVATPAKVNSIFNTEEILDENTLETKTLQDWHPVGATRQKLIEINVAEISGQFEGALTAHHRLVIHSKGSVKGRIRYAELEVDRGGRIEGDVEPISDSEITDILSGTSGEEQTE